MNKPYFFVFPFVMKINYSASQSMRVWTAQICLIKRLFSSLLILYICFRSMMIINKKIIILLVLKRLGSHMGI